MTRLFRAVWTILTSRALPPLVIGFFLVVYIGIAFFSDETLITLMAITRRNAFLAAVLALLPLNSACRIMVETAGFLKRRRALTDAASALQPALYDETVDLAASPALPDLEGRLGAAGYATRLSGSLLAAWRGVSLAPARIVFLAGTFCLFAGILVSLTSRTVYRQAVIEGDAFPTSTGTGGTVERIVFRNASGPILSRELVMEVAASGPGKEGERFGVYPPSLFGGAFVYPRYLGIALNYRLSAPDLPAAKEGVAVLPIYPPGRESAEAISGSPYRLAVSMVKPDDGSDPYMTGRMVFLFKLLKDKDVLITGSVPRGGEFARDGFRLAIPDARRVVITDFIGDYGVLLIWAAALLFLIAASAWLPVRLFFPRREMLFRTDQGFVRACSRAEGGGRKHAGVFHEVLDVIEAKRSSGQ